MRGTGGRLGAWCEARSEVPDKLKLECRGEWVRVRDVGMTKTQDAMGRSNDEDARRSGDAIREHCTQDAVGNAIKYVAVSSKTQGGGLVDGKDGWHGGGGL